jgi:hypothetical protein
LRNFGMDLLSLFEYVSQTFCHALLLYPVRNNVSLLPPGQRPSGPAAAAGLYFRIIPVGFNTPLEFLTGFNHSLNILHSF